MTKQIDPTTGVVMSSAIEYFQWCVRASIAGIAKADEAVVNPPQNPETIIWCM